MDLQSSKLPIECPECDSSFQVTLGQMTRGATVACPRGHRVELVMDAKSRREVQQPDQAFKRLQDTFRRF